MASEPAGDVDLTTQADFVAVTAALSCSVADAPPAPYEFAGTDEITRPVALESSGGFRRDVVTSLDLAVRDGAGSCP